MTSKADRQQTATLPGEITQQARETQAKRLVRHFGLGTSAQKSDSTSTISSQSAPSLWIGKRIGMTLVSRIAGGRQGDADEEESLVHRGMDLCRRYGMWRLGFVAVVLLALAVMAIHFAFSDSKRSPDSRRELATIPVPTHYDDASDVAGQSERSAAAMVSDRQVVVALDGEADGETSAKSSNMPDATASDAAQLRIDRTASSGSRSTPESFSWPVTPLVGALINAEFVATADLQAAYLEAESVRDAFFAGGLTEARDVSTKGKAYKSLCVLANALTMLEPMKLNLEVASQQSLGKGLLRGIAAEEDHRLLLGQIAIRWWEFKQRPVSGIFFVGEVSAVDAVGKWTQYQVDLNWGEGRTSIPVLCDGMRAGTGQNVAVIGVVVDNPRESLKNYGLSTPQLVLAGHLIPLGNAPSGN